LKRTPITFLPESKYYIKNIIETKKTAGGMKGIKNTNDSASPSPLLCIREVKE
jgi:hypothetical protein